ncbi:MAG: ectonucleotide pyrophosphatase/phosphodiesterase [Bacteroidota bacterium]
MKRVLITIILIFFVLMLFNWLMPATESNRMAAEDPIVILVSIDGYRADYLDQYPSPNISALAARGVRAEGMIAAHPTKTFPNHYTIVTGRYPSNHGIVANVMYDPVFDETFTMSKRHEVENPRWWEGEPLWVTAELQGVKSGTYFWPGSEAPIKDVRPSFWKRYDGSVPGNRRVDEILSWLDLDPAERPRFITLYFSDVDAQGHRHGPASGEVEEAIDRVDGYIGRLLDGITSRGLNSAVNVIVVSDHGMAQTSPDKVIFIDEYIDVDDVKIIETTPALMINPVEGQTENVYRALQNAHPALDAHRVGAYPVDWHWEGHRRIPQLVALADEGWSIVTNRAAFESGETMLSEGVHGYDRQLPSMHALFVADGPAFANGKQVPPFENIHVYPLVAHILSLTPTEVDGRLDAVWHLLESTSE